MGRNNLENRSKDINWGFNNTQQVPFKFEILSEQQCRNFELAQGLEMHKLSLTIRLNAKYNVSINDVVVVKGQKYMVITTSDSFENPTQGRYKGLLKDFTGSMIVGLE